VLGRDYASQDCSIARSLEVIGERWSLLVIRDLSFGVTRFDDLTASLQIAPNVLSTRLKRLEDAGLVERRAYQERPRRWEYHLTDKGRALQPVLFHLAKWGDRFYPSEQGPPRRALHSECGGEIDQQMTCNRCGEAVWFDAVETVDRDAGPALTARP